MIGKESPRLASSGARQVNNVEGIVAGRAEKLGPDLGQIWAILGQIWAILGLITIEIIEMTALSRQTSPSLDLSFFQ